MSIQAIVDQIKGNVESSDFDGIIKFDCGDDGLIVIDGNTISTEDKEADCTIGVALADLEAIVAGDLDPTAAFMQGKFDIDGDMSLAMKLGQLMG
ncbi:SCP2 sterol-binding domain-containing protein [Rhodobacteraceae bacterium RKSG542]|uniref:SCP2 sterol-binding domain-containing protein n=1 Tax=Pseudovibrio flavus TaxID=2529854 RepID=UPI0012BD0F47|nr:SCP2 sterol-binding domain-containing protein [Pseudovibrio flavus]MTI16304.1 SCP2 sterol-binding domain-containing protein [Pseudovibrio flavus]